MAGIFICDIPACKSDINTNLIISKTLQNANANLKWIKPNCCVYIKIVANL